MKGDGFGCGEGVRGGVCLGGVRAGRSVADLLVQEHLCSLQEEGCALGLSQQRDVALLGVSGDGCCATL